MARLRPRLDETGLAVGITVFDHPQNPRHPTEWFAMQNPFAYVTASPVATEPIVLDTSTPLALTYALWAHTGFIEPEQAEDVYRDW